MIEKTMCGARCVTRRAVRDMVLTPRQFAMASAGNDFDGAAQVFADCRRQVKTAAADLKLAERWSLFDPSVRKAHFAALQRHADLAR